jgi:TolB-like protein
VKLKNKGTKRLIAMAAIILFSATAAMSTAPKRLLILPFHIHAEKNLDFLQKGLLDMLSTRLSLAGKTITIPKEDVRMAIENMPKPIEEKAAILLGVSLGADYVVQGSLTVVGTNISTDARFIDVGQQAPVVTFNQFGANQGDVISHVNQFAGQVSEDIFGISSRHYPAQTAPAASAAPIAGSTQVPLSSRAHPEEAFEKNFGGGGGIMGPGGGAASAGRLRFATWKSRNFATQIKGMAVGDVDGDGKMELAFIDERTVHIYRLAGSKFAKISEIDSSRSNRHISVDIADINGNGMAEIYVTSLYGAENRLMSFVLEHNGADFTRISDGLGYYFRVIDHPQRGRVLLGQQQGIQKVFGRNIHELLWAGGRLDVASPASLPKGINVFGFTYGDVMNNGVEMIVASKKNDTLGVFVPGGNEEWVSEDRFGGSTIYLEPKGANKPVSGSQRDDYQKVMNRIYLPQRILVKDLDKDGKNEVLAVQNKDATGRYLQRIRVFRSGHIKCLQWEGLGLYEKWRVRKVSGHVSDFTVADFDNDGEDEIVFAVVAKVASGIGTGKSYIASQELK